MKISRETQENIIAAAVTFVFVALTVGGMWLMTVNTPVRDSCYDISKSFYDAGNAPRHCYEAKP